MRASGATELRKFSHSKTAISFNILLVLQKHIYFRVSNNICIDNTQSMHFPFINYGMMIYRADKTLTLRKCMYICERAERASFKNFAISFNILLVLQI